MFGRVGAGLVPRDEALSSWGRRSTVRGLAVSGALAREAESALVAQGLHDYRPARWTVDLSRPTAMGVCTTRAVVLRTGRRAALIDVELVQGDTVTARGRAMFARPGAPASGRVWSSGVVVEPPPADLRPTSREGRLYHSAEVGWTSAAADHHNAGRKQLWLPPLCLVEGEQATAFQQVAAYADLASVVTSWGDQGLRYVNADISLHLARRPMRLAAGMGLGVVEHLEADGLAVGTATICDREGTFGLVSVTGLANEAQVVDPGRRD